MPPMATTTGSDSTAAAAGRLAVASGVPIQHAKAAVLAPVPMPMPADGAAQQLMILYGGRVVVFDGCQPAKVAELILYAAAAAASPPVGRKKSLERFLLKRKNRYATAAAEGRLREDTSVPPPPKKGKTEASSWLTLAPW
uniref:Uncharacterized protein n=1 Tax=Avena sativa TaxID=4498 RepID=A0ACD5TVC0_AVESA